MQMMMSDLETAELGKKKKKYLAEGGYGLT